MQQIRYHHKLRPQETVGRFAFLRFTTFLDHP